MTLRAPPTGKTLPRSIVFQVQFTASGAWEGEGPGSRHLDQDSAGVDASNLWQVALSGGKQKAVSV